MIKFFELLNETVRRIPLWIRTATIVVYGTTLGYYAYTTLDISKRRGTQSEKHLYRIEKAIDETRASLIKQPLDEKKQAFLNIPNVLFHYANKDEIRNLYNDYFKEPTIEQVIKEMSSEATTEGAAKLAEVLEAKAGSRDLTKWISTIKVPDISVAEMFRRYQRETINNNQVLLGLDLVDIDLTELDAFDKSVSHLKSEFAIKIDELQLTTKRTNLKRKAAEKTMARLESAAGLVLIEGKFSITDHSEKSYRCTYYHPVNEYVSEKGKVVLITFPLTKDAVEPNIAGNYAQSIGRSIPLRVYGTVWQPLDRKAGIHELQITPLAVY